MQEITETFFKLKQQLNCLVVLEHPETLLSKNGKLVLQKNDSFSKLVLETEAEEAPKAQPQEQQEQQQQEQQQQQQTAAEETKEEGKAAFTGNLEKTISTISSASVSSASVSAAPLLTFLEWLSTKKVRKSTSSYSSAVQ